MSIEAHVTPSADRPLVSIIVVNFNGKQFLTECLNSAFDKAFKKYPFEIVVVDNCSQDGSQQLLRARPDITYIESDTNTGFTGGNNLGVRAAKGELVFLLNNDTRVETCLDPLVDTILESGAGAIGCQLRYADGRLQFSMGHEHSPWRILLSWLGLERQACLPSVFRRMDTRPESYHQQHASAAWISGAALLTPRKVWDELDGLDEVFFMYCEDVDYCHRVKTHGLEVRYRGDCVITHYEGAGRPWIGTRALQNTSRSYFLFLTKHYGLMVARVTCLALGGVFFARAMAFKLIALKHRSEACSKIRADKGSAYKRAAQRLIQSALSGKAPVRA